MTRSSLIPSARKTNEEISATFNSVNPNHRCVYEVVDYLDLDIDPTIQRDQVPGEIKKIVAGFNPAALGVLTVSVREVMDPETHKVVNRRFVVDGQQRQAALIVLEYQHKVPALVHYGLSKEEEATLFLLLNDREGVGPWSRFKARLQANEPQALAILQIFEEIGLPFNVAKGFQSITKADAIFSNGATGPAALRFALSMLHEIYGAYDGRAVGGLAMLYQEYNKFLDVEMLRRKLQEYCPTIGQLVRDAKILQQLYGGKTDPAFAEALVNLYNRGTRSNAKRSKALPSFFHGKRRKPSGTDLDELASLRTDAAENREIDEDDLNDEDLEEV